jgi:hypothetical protein
LHTIGNNAVGIHPDCLRGHVRPHTQLPTADLIDHFKGLQIEVFTAANKQGI